MSPFQDSGPHPWSQSQLSHQIPREAVISTVLVICQSTGPNFGLVFGFLSLMWHENKGSVSTGIICPWCPDGAWSHALETLSSGLPPGAPDTPASPACSPCPRACHVVLGQAHVASLSMTSVVTSLQGLQVTVKYLFHH